MTVLLLSFSVTITRTLVKRSEDDVLSQLRRVKFNLLVYFKYSRRIISFSPLVVAVHL